MAILNYKVVDKEKEAAEKRKQEELANKNKAMRASKQAVVNNAMLTKVPSAQPVPNQAANPQVQQGWGGVK